MANTKKASKKKFTGWSDSEMQHFVDGKNDKEIAGLTGRTPGAVGAKRNTDEIRLLMGKPARNGQKVVKRGYNMKNKGNGKVETINPVSTLKFNLPPTGTFEVQVEGISINIDVAQCKGINISNGSITPVRR